MTKVILTTGLILAIISNIFSQDILYKKDGTEIKAKVIEITNSLIKYKKYDQLDGPIRNLEISELFMIIYQNGTRENFAVNQHNANEVYPPNKQQSKANNMELDQLTTTATNKKNQQYNLNQNTSEFKKFNWGFQGGMVFPKWNSGDGGENINDYIPPKTSYFAGFFSKASFNDYLSLQFELSYISNRFGASGHVSNGSSSYDSEGVLSMNYLQIPMLLKVNFRNSTKIKPGIFIGPEINVKLSAKAKGTYTNNLGNSGDLTQDFDNDYKSTYFGFTSGFGCVFNHFLVEARYDFGLSNIGGEAKLNSARVSVGFHF